MININHAHRTSFYREFYAVDVNPDATLNLHVRTLNIFQRALRYLFGAYSNTIWNQTKSTELRNLYPAEWKKIENQVLDPDTFQKVFKIAKEVEVVETDVQNYNLDSTDDDIKIVEKLRWVLDNAANSHDKNKLLVQEFIVDLQKKSQVMGMEYEGTYLSWIEELDPEQLRVYFQLLPIKGSNSPLLFHLRKEHGAAALTGKTTHDEIGKRVQIIFSTFSAEHARSVIHCEEFWNLLYQYPTEAATWLSPEVLGILVRNKKKQKIEFNKVISRLPEDDQLYDKLCAIAPYSSRYIELALKSKAERIDKFNSKINNVPISHNQKRTMKDDLLLKIKAGIKMQNKEMRTGNSLQDVKSRNSRSFKFRERSASNATDESKSMPVLPVSRQKETWPDDRCITYLKKNKYTVTENVSDEDIVFRWILNHGHLYDNEHLHHEFIAFIKYTLSKPLYENTTFMLDEMNEDQLRFFVKLLGKEMIDILWNLESKFTVSLTSVNNKISRLETIIKSLSEEQFAASLNTEKFFEIIRNYPIEMSRLLTPEQWEKIAANPNLQEDVLSALSAMISKINKEDPHFEDKLYAASSLMKDRTEEAPKKKLRQGLQFQIESKLMFCSQEMQSKINSF